jgi:hypothetical protein
MKRNVLLKTTDVFDHVILDAGEMTIRLRWRRVERKINFGQFSPALMCLSVCQVNVASEFVYIIIGFQNSLLRTATDLLGDLALDLERGACGISPRGLKKKFCLHVVTVCSPEFAASPSVSGGKPPLSRRCARASL